MSLAASAWRRIDRLARSAPIRYLVVGGANTLLYAAVSLTFMHVLPVSEKVSSVVAYLLCLPVSFFTQKQLVFSPESQVLAAQIARFLATHAINITLAYTVVLATIEILGWSREVAVILSCATVAAVGYVLMKQWVFADRETV